MYLKYLDYSEFDGTPDEWSIEGFTLKKINLIVGKNASGKTRALNIIANLGNLISGYKPQLYSSGNHLLKFNNDTRLEYLLKLKDNKVIEEKLIKDNKTLLDRGMNGIGKIFAVKINDFIDFQTPDNVLACSARRDSVQHPYFEELFQWGDLIRHYHFGSQLGKDHLIISTPDKPAKVDLKDENSIVFKIGLESFGEEFTELIIDDMRHIGYDIEIAVYAPLPSIKVQGLPAGEVIGIIVKESSVNKHISQLDMSQGMFRALALLIHINYNLLTKTPNCLLIDNIGEGLDFERSTALIKLLIDKAKESAVQLIMTTNDRFTMNSVPLEYWSVIHRVGGKCRVFNYDNSRKIFDEFVYTGLSNFDFFATEFYEKGFDEK